MEGEKTIRSIGIHWKNYIFPLFSLLLLEIIMLIRYELLDFSIINVLTCRLTGKLPMEMKIQTTLSTLELVLLGAVMLRVLIRIVRIYNIRYILTDRRVIIRRGLLNIYENEMLIDSLWNVQLKQSLYESLFNTGDLLLSSAAASFYLDDVRNVREFKTKIESLIKR